MANPIPSQFFKEIRSLNKSMPSSVDSNTMLMLLITNNKEEGKNSLFKADKKKKIEK